MRNDLNTIVWAAECHPKVRSWKVILLNLCHHSNAEGEAYPSTVTIARETGYTKRAVINALEGLETAGIIRRTGVCGYHNGVVRYSLNGIPESVHNLARGEMTSRLVKSRGEVSSKKGPLRGEVSSTRGEVSSPRSILGNKEVSKLVSIGARGEMTSPLVHNSPKWDAPGGGGKGGTGKPPVAPSARNEGTPAASGESDYGALVRTPGWIPMTDEDRRNVMRYCYERGASRSEAEAFIRYNAVRRWACCSKGGTVNDAVKEWIERWIDRDQKGYMAERARRRANDASRTMN